jgi:hypothetical protein
MEHRRNAGRIIPHGEISDAGFAAMGWPAHRDDGT